MSVGGAKQDSIKNSLLKKSWNEGKNKNSWLLFYTNKSAIFPINAWKDQIMKIQLLANKLGHSFNKNINFLGINRSSLKYFLYSQISQTLDRQCLSIIIFKIELSISKLQETKFDRKKLQGIQD